jgi:hypothetical protein
MNIYKGVYKMKVYEKNTIIIVLQNGKVFTVGNIPENYNYQVINLDEKMSHLKNIKRA